MLNLKKKLMDLAKQNLMFRKIFRRGLLIFRYIRFQKRSLGKKVDAKLMIFNAFNGKSYADSPKAIYKYMLNSEKYKDYKFVWSFKNPENYEFLKENDRTIVIKHGGKIYEQYLAKAKYWVFNYRAADHQYPKKNQVYVQCWHGTPLKRLGYDLENTNNVLNTKNEVRYKYKIDAKKFKYMVSPSSFTTEKFISAWNLKEAKKEDCIIEKGYPRNDFLYNYTKNDVRDIKKKLGIEGINKKIILYAPTWRDNQHTSGVGYTYKTAIDFDYLKEKLEQDYIILFRAHYLVASEFDFKKYEGFIYDVSRFDDINELYVISDLLITDYSSVFFDYANLKRPIIFYMYDLAEYQNETRGFYLDLKELPGNIVKTEKDLIQEINNKFVYNEKYKAFNKKYNYLEDGNASERVVNKFVRSKSAKPLLINIFKKVKYKDEKINFKAIALFKLLCSKEKPDIEKVRLKIGDHFYKIKLKKLIKLPRRIYLVKYSFEIDIEDVNELDIQNKILVVYDKYIGRIVYNIFDLTTGHYRNSKIIFHDETSIYFRQTGKNTMYLTIRETNVFDHNKSQFRLFIANILSKFLFKNIILLYEKEASRYEESASILYEKLIDNGYKNVYYIINKDNHRLDTLEEKYLKNMIYKNTMKHLIYFFRCKNFIGTETVGHAIQLRIANKRVAKKVAQGKINYVFLQHGVMYMISLDSDMRSGFRNNNYNKFKVVVSSELEANHFIELGGFEKEDLYVTGLAKFDKSIRNEKPDKIVIMPTWRRWETNQARIDFKETNYYKMIYRIVQSIPEKYKDKLIVLPHPLMLSAMEHSDCELKKYFIEDKSYDEILRECSLLITDYSSISYDAFYRGCNVIFYWEEKDECLKMYGKNTKLMLTEDLAFGDVCYNIEELKNAFQNSYLKERTKENIEKYKKIVEFDDGNNTKRIIEKLKEENFI